MQETRPEHPPLRTCPKIICKEKANKPGNVCCGCCYGIDRPVSRRLNFCQRPKLSDGNKVLRDGGIHKTYWALVEGVQGARKRRGNFLVSRRKNKLDFRFRLQKPEAKINTELQELLQGRQIHSS